MKTSDIIILLIVVAYVASPIDLLPESLPVIGNTVGSVDDSLLVLLSLLHQMRAKNKASQDMHEDE